MAPCGRPSFPCGVYSTWILLNAKLTSSNRFALPPVSPPSIVRFVTRPFSIVTLRNSSWLLPALRNVSTAFRIASLVRSASIKGVEALSTFFRIFCSLMLALPVAAPPPRLGFACIPHDQLKTSISPLCCVSCDSPLIRPHFAPLTMRNISPAPSLIAGSHSGCHRLRGCDPPEGGHDDCHGSSCPPNLPLLTFLVPLDVVFEVHAGVERAVRLLRLILQIDFGELQRDVLG